MEQINSRINIYVLLSRILLQELDSEAALEVSSGHIGVELEFLLSDNEYLQSVLNN